MPEVKEIIQTLSYETKGLEAINDVTDALNRLHDAVNKLAEIGIYIKVNIVTS